MNAARGHSCQRQSTMMPMGIGTRGRCSSRLHDPRDTEERGCLSSRHRWGRTGRHRAVSGDCSMRAVPSVCKCPIRRVPGSSPGKGAQLPPGMLSGTRAPFPCTMCACLPFLVHLGPLTLSGIMTPLAIPMDLLHSAKANVIGPGQPPMPASSANSEHCHQLSDEANATAVECPDARSPSDACLCGIET